MGKKTEVTGTSCRNQTEVVPQVLQQWMAAARAPRSRPVEDMLQQEEEEEDDCPVLKKKPKLAAARPIKAAKPRAPAASARTKKSRAIIESDSSESEEEVQKGPRYGTV